MTSGDFVTNQAKVISFTDPDGNEWTLIVPKNALMSNETITMRYISGVQQDVFSGSQCAGVVFEPDGLHFIEPVYLEVKGAAISDKSCFLSATSDGANLNFSRSVFSEGQLTATIEHFSSYITYTPTSQPQIDQLAQIAAEDYKHAVKEVKEFLNSPISVPPVPPDVEYSCKSGMNRALNMYVARASQPESELIKRILAAGRASGLFGNEEDAIDYARQLSSRLLRKAIKLIRTYSNDNKKLIPVMNFTINVLKNADSLGTDTNLSDYLETFSDWTECAVKELIDEIKTKHTYTNLCKMMALLHGKAIIEPSFEQTEGMLEAYQQELSDAYYFHLSYEGRITDTDSDGGQSVWEVSGEVALTFDMIKSTDNGLFLSGTGTCEYTDFTYNGKRDTRLAPSLESIAVNVYITEKKDNLYMLSVNVDTIAPDSMVYTDKDGDNMTIAGMKSVYNYVFVDYYDGAYYNFDINLQNGLAEFTHNISGEADSSQGSYDFTLKHTPK